MKNKNKILFLFIVAVVISFFVIKNYCIKKSIEEGYTSFMDVKLEIFMAEDEYIQQANVEEVDYQVKKISKYKDTYSEAYMIETEIYLTCNKDSSDFDVQMAAYGLEYEFKIYDIEINGYKCDHRSLKYNDFYMEDLITVYINNEKFIYPKSKTEREKESNVSKDTICRHAGCGKEAERSEWAYRFCSEHMQDEITCRYPGCDVKIPNYMGKNTAGKHFCDKHD